MTLSGCFYLRMCAKEILCLSSRRAGARARASRAERQVTAEVVDSCQCTWAQVGGGGLVPVHTQA